MSFLPRRSVSVRRGAVHAFGLSAAGLAATFVTGVIAARALHPDGRGVLAAVLAAPNLATWVFGVGAMEATAYGRAKYSGTGPSLLSTWLLILMPVGLVSLVILELTLPVLLTAQQSHTVWLARLWAPTILLALLMLILNGTLLGTHDYERFNLSRNTPFFITALLYCVFVAAHSFSVGTALVATLVGSILNAAIIGALVMTRYGGLGKPKVAIAKSTLSYGLRAHGSNLSSIVNGRLDLLVMPAFLGAASVGLYSVGTNISWIVVTVAGAAAPLLVPAVAAHSGSDRTHRVVVGGVVITLIVATGLAVGIGILAYPLVHLLYGRAFLAGVPALELLLPGCVLLAGAQALWAGLSGLGRPGLAALSQLPAVAVTLVGLALFLRAGGITAAASVSSTAYATSFLCAGALYLWTAKLSLRLVASLGLEIIQSAARTASSKGKDLLGRMHWAPGAGPFVIGAVSSVACGGLAAAVHPLTVSPRIAVAGLAFLGCAVLVTSLSHAIQSLRRSNRFAYGGSTMVATATLIGIVIPGAQLILGARQSRLLEFGAYVPTATHNTDIGILIAAVALLAFVGGDLVASRLKGPTPSVQGRSGDIWERVDTKRIFYVLIGVGVMATLLQPGSQQEIFASRGQVSGQGILHLALHALPLGVALAITKRHWGSRGLVFLNMLLLLLIVRGGTREPLLLIAIAVGIRVLRTIAGRKFRVRYLIVTCCLAYVGLVTAVALPAWRAEVAHGSGASLPRELLKAASDPVSRMTTAGLDTYDGLILSTYVDRHRVGATVTDPLKALTTFVPRQVWPTKPEFLGPIVTHLYTRIGGRAGIFLSGPGYAFLITGGVLGAAVLFALLGIAAGWALRSLAVDSVLLVLVSYFLFRFVIAGDAFDLFNLFGYFVLLGGAHVCVLIYRTSLGKRELAAHGHAY